MSGTNEPRIYQGLAVAEGVAVGRVKVIDTAHLPSRAPRYEIGEGDIQREVRRLKDACAAAREELERMAERVREQVGPREAEMISAQVLMVEDPAFVAEVEDLIVENRVNAEAAVAEVMERFEGLVSAVDDPYLRERSSDIRDAGRRILARLLFVEGEVSPALTEPSVVVASHLVPSLTVHLQREKVLAFASEHGGYTSHAAILARSLGVPAVTGLKGLTDEVLDGETIIVDGLNGMAIVEPTAAQTEAYRARAERWREKRVDLISRTAEPAVTTDGMRISVMANVGSSSDLELAREYRADGIGLYRTEVEYLTHTSLPSEDTLAEEYGRATALFSEEGVVFRALDIGGDKFPPSVPLAHEDNPFIGMRGLRLLLEHTEDLMLPQLHSIIRASAKGRTAVMYPMIASVSDLEAALELFDRALEEVRGQGYSPAEDIPQGIMVEVPSCIPMLPELLGRADFASVGTNDLVQYLLAADRNSERMMDAYDPFHPAVVRTLQAIRRAADQAEKQVSVCGEAAGDPAFLPLLIGLGYRKISVNIGAVARVKGLIRALTIERCEALAERALTARTGDEIREAARQMTADAVPGG